MGYNYDKVLKTMSNRDILHDHHGLKRDKLAKSPGLRKSINKEMARRKKAGLMKKSAGHTKSQNPWGINIKLPKW